MSGPLFWKVLRDLRWPLLLVSVLLVGFGMLWAKITQLVQSQILPVLAKIYDAFQRQGLKDADINALTDEVLGGPVKMLRTLLGGDLIDLANPVNTLAISFVHPFVQTVFGIWAITRAASAIAGEIDRGTMELLLAQPITRRQIVLTHVLVDLVAIPCLGLSLLLGLWLGTLAVGLQEDHTFPWLQFAGAALNGMALMFAISGYTLALSAMGRFRWRVMSVALGISLVQFLVNLFGQLWSVLTPLRPLTVFYYYQPQPIIVTNNWRIAIGQEWPLFSTHDTVLTVWVVPVLLAVGLAGYALALRLFTCRDLPAPL
jgi:ABC-2 type transport system permease protein